jgi:hypothetical protein
MNGRRSTALRAYPTVLKRDAFSPNRHPALSFCLNMVFSENRFPLFRIMFQNRDPFGNLGNDGGYPDRPFASPASSGLRWKARSRANGTGPHLNEVQDKLAFKSIAAAKAQ